MMEAQDSKDDLRSEVARHDSGISLSGFLDRCNLPSSTREKCDAFVATRFSGGHARPAPSQGYCSYTVFVAENTIVQFRPPEHDIDPDLVMEARNVFRADIVPETKRLGFMRTTGRSLELGDGPIVGGSCLTVYTMRRLPGIPLAELYDHSSKGTIDTFSRARKCQRRHLVEKFAQMQAQSWKHAVSASKLPLRPETQGKVGSSLRWRLEKMASDLPVRFQEIVRETMAMLPEIENHLHWTLTHGDFIPANILMSPETGRLSGLLDWAEAEYLPFGVGLYGLEELLGEVCRGDNDGGIGEFKYYSDAREFRALFWRSLRRAVPDLKQNLDFACRLHQAQVLGLLLWHGIAFDNGKLDRVVEEGLDDAELQRLDAYFFDPLGPVCGMRATRK